ncbi:MAG TPA: 30S ribosomal protein S10 [Candidatus Absconditabacterales bacterium]|nr:30S ribosomal protein S10 [Candidatus Absconditabacterales bacterium]HNG96734.1 30S ribosomal protein S10 [Candidatus Absconditabacterales bacterium]
MAETKKTTTKATTKKTTTKAVSVKATSSDKTKATKTVASSEVTATKIAKQVKKASSYEPKLRIKLKSYDVRMLEASSGKIVSMLTKSGASIKGPIPLPKWRKLYTVNTSHFVDKDSREQYEQFVYTRLIDVVETGPKTMENLQNISIPVGVSVEVKVF